MKHLLSFFFVCCAFLTGCGASQTPPQNTFCLQVELDDNGMVTQTVEIPTFSNEEAYLKELLSNIEKKIYNNYYITYYIACLKSGEDLKNLTFIKPQYNKDGQKIVFSFQFSNQKTLSLINKETGSLCLTFLETIKAEKEFPFFEMNKSGIRVCDYYIDVVNETYSKYFGKTLDVQEVLLEYKYITPYNNLHSNADFKNGNAHSWIAGINDSQSDKKIELWITQVSRGMWYLVIIFLMAIVYLPLYLCFNKKSLFKRKNRPKREKVG